MKFKIYEDKAGLFRWRLVSGNGRIVADSGEGYATRKNAERAAFRLNEAIIYEGHFITIVDEPNKPIDNSARV